MSSEAREWLGLHTSTSTQLQLPWGKNYSTRVRVIQRSWRIVNNKAWNSLLSVVFAFFEVFFVGRRGWRWTPRRRASNQNGGWLYRWVPRVGKFGIGFCWSNLRSHPGNLWMWQHVASWFALPKYQHQWRVITVMLLASGCICIYIYTSVAKTKVEGRLFYRLQRADENQW